MSGERLQDHWSSGLYVYIYEERIGPSTEPRGTPDVTGMDFFSLFPTGLMFNSCPARIQTTLYRFHSYQAVIG